MSDRPPDDISGFLASASALRMDRRRFLQVAGATGVAAVAAHLGLLQAQQSVFAAEPQSSATALGTQIDRLARSLGYDTERIFRFVADEIRYEPYGGVLRGATGTLWGRAGNSADQAMLLAALLGASLVPYRFVTGALDDAAAARLLARPVTDATTVRDQALEVMISHAGADETRQPAPLEPSLQAFVDGLPAAGAAVVDTAGAQLAQGIETIGSALRAAGITIPSADRALPGLEQDQHVWVQYGSGPSWIDLDPTLAGAQVGQVMSTASAPLDALPDGLRHRVEFSVIAESIVGGQLQQGPIFQHAEFADELVGVPVTFLNAKPAGLTALGAVIAGAIEGTVQYVPVLVVGARSIIGPTPLLFGNQGGQAAPPGDAVLAEGEATAEWLEISISSPETDVVTSRREIFDRIGFVARATGGVDATSVAPVELVDIDPETHDEYLPCGVVHSFAILSTALSGEYFVQDYEGNSGLATLALVSHIYHYVREGLSAEVGADHGVRTYLDAPNVVSYTLVPEQPANGTLAIRTALDIWHRSFGLGPVSGVPATAPPAVVAGVLSHVAERIALGEGLPADPDVPMRTWVSVGRVFEEAARQGIPSVALQGPTVASTLPYEPEAAARIAERLSAGLVVVVPERAVDLDGGQRLGWWLVDPVTGQTLDESEDGRGTDAVEEPILLPYTTETKAIQEWLRINCVFFKAYLTFGRYLGLVGAVASAAGQPHLAEMLAAAAAVARALNAGGVPGSLPC